MSVTVGPDIGSGASPVEVQLTDGGEQDCRLRQPAAGSASGMTDTMLLIVGLALLAAVVISGAAVVFGIKARRSTFAGPPRDARELTRHDLSRGDQWRV